MMQFASLRDAAARDRLPEPRAQETFESCKLDWGGVESHPEVLALHRDLLAFRRTTRTFNQAKINGSVVGPEAFLLRFFADLPADERLLLLNIGRNLRLPSIPDPLFAPPAETDWYVIWSSEDACYGGGGRRQVQTKERFVLTADSAILLAPMSRHARLEMDDLQAWQRAIG